MKFMIFFAAVLSLALAAPQYLYDAPGSSSSEEEQEEIEKEVVEILKDERVNDGDGKYSFDFEASNGIRFAEIGAPDGEDDAVLQAGQYSYTAPDGTEVELKYVADENGFQPESDLLPVAPEFPHEIPQFVIDQIEKAAEEDATAAEEEDEEEEDEEQEEEEDEDEDESDSSSEESFRTSRRKYGHRS